jgi:beta-lactam-binding protein with PASTA domain
MKQDGKAEESKLNVEIAEERFDPTIEAGKIISQDPTFQANYTIKEGTAIKVVLSKGQEIVVVPTVKGETKDAAINILTEAKLAYELIEEYSDDIEKDIIIKQEVEPGEEILAGTAIKIYVSKGIEQVQVPDLSNKTEAEAKKLITDSKLKYKATIKTDDNSKKNRVIVDQSISAGSMVNKDTEITITLNEFDEIKSAKVTINVKSLLGYRAQSIEGDDGVMTPIPPKQVTLRVTVDEEQILSKQVSEDTENEVVTFEDSGTVEIKVYIDGSRKATKQLNLNSGTTITID